jgi:HNH endonuclease
VIKPCKLCGLPFEDLIGLRYCSFQCRLWSKIDVRGEDECWPLIRVPKRYGSMGKTPLRKRTSIHKAVFESMHRPLGPDEFACHSCDNKWCCNPAHLWPGTTTDNMRDASQKGLLARGSDVVHSVLTEAQVRIIREFSFALFSHREVADVLGCNKESIGRIVRRETWAHLQ